MNFMDIKTEIQKIIEIQCPICYRDYDDQEIVPMLICFGQHSICKECLRRTFQNLDYNQAANCPICNEEFSEEYSSKFRLMGDVIEITKFFENVCELKSQECDALKYQNSQLEKKLINQKILYEMKKEELLKVKEQVKKVNQQKIKQKRYYIDVRPASANKKTNKQGKNSKFPSFYSKPNSKRQKLKTNATLKPTSSEFYNEKTCFLQPKQAIKLKETPKNVKSYAYHEGYPYLKTKNLNYKISKQRLQLPFFINTRQVTSAQLHELKKIENNEIKLSVRQSCIDVLKRFNFSRVISLILSNLDFSEKYFASFESAHTLLSLRSLNLSKNRLSNVPGFIFELKSLRVLNLNHNNISGLVPAVKTLKYLERLLLWNNKLIFLPEQLCDLTHLREIQVSNNRIVMVPTFLCDIPKLRKIGLFGNPINWAQVSYQIVKDLRSKQVSVELG